MSDQANSSIQATAREGGQNTRTSPDTDQVLSGWARAVTDQPAQSLAGRCRVARTEQTDRKVAVIIEPMALCATFGVEDPRLAARMLSQLLSILQPNPNEPVDAETINQALAVIDGIRPTDVLEAMTATMLVGAHHAALDALRREIHPDQTPGGRRLYGGLALKAMRTYAQLLEALNHGRGKGGTQQIIVKRVTVEAGAQAVVGSVELNRGRGDANPTRLSHGPGSDGSRRKYEETGG